MVFFIVGSLLTAPEGIQPSQIINVHNKSLSAIHSIHMKTELWIKAVDTELTKVNETELWRDGFRERSIQRDYVIWTPKGKIENPDGDVRIVTLTDKEIRTLNGWDPDNPASLPIDFVKKSSDFRRIRGSIQHRSPIVGGSNIVQKVYPGVTLSDVADFSEFSQVPSDFAERSVEVKASKKPFSLVCL